MKWNVVVVVVGLLDPSLLHGTTLCRLPQILLSHYWVKLDWHPSLKVRPLIPDLPLPACYSQHIPLYSARFL